eukprot:2707393-Amphidinium_carterae.1
MDFSPTLPSLMLRFNVFSFRDLRRECWTILTSGRAFIASSLRFSAPLFTAQLYPDTVRSKEGREAAHTTVGHMTSWYSTSFPIPGRPGDSSLSLPSGTTASPKR